MQTLYELYKDKNISRSDWEAGQTYLMLRKMFLRSQAIKNTLHKSSIEKAYQTKGFVHDHFQSSELESFWRGLKHYAEFDSFPFLKVLDIVTGLNPVESDIQLCFVKKALKKNQMCL